MHYNQNVSQVDQQYAFANLSTDLVADIQKLEKRLKDATQKEVILIAYEDKGDFKWTVSQLPEKQTCDSK